MGSSGHAPTPPKTLVILATKTTKQALSGLYQQVDVPLRA